MEEAQLRAEMCEVGRRLWQRGLVGATEGNLSARLSENRILCTPSGLSKGHLVPDDLVVIDGDGELIRTTLAMIGDEGGRPSSEIKLHLRILQRRQDCQAVAHAHPPIATGFTLADEPIPDDLLPEAIHVLGPVATIPFAMPGTDEVPDAIEPLLAGHKTFLLSHHGAATLGSSLMDAYHRMETLERIARIVLTARLLGKAVQLPSEAVARLAHLMNGEL